MTPVVLHYPSPILALGAGLQQAVAQLFPQATPAGSIRRAKGVDATVYISPVALQLSREAQRPALEVAEQLVALLSQQDTPTALDIHPEVHPPGWLVWTLPAASIAAWLQQLTQTPPARIGNRETATKLSSPQILAATTDSLVFELHYGHARCCSLLRLGHRQGYIQLSASLWGIQDPQPLPWLRSDNRPRLEHPAEQALIRALLEFPLGWLEGGSVSARPGEHTWSVAQPLAPQQLEQQAKTLSAAFQTFYRCCPIGGESRQNPALAQVRLGLMQAARHLFRFLIQERFGSEALLEL